MTLPDANRLTDQFLAFTKIDSPSFHEGEMAAYVKQVFQDLGIVLHEDDANKYYGSQTGNLYGCWQGTLPGEPILFMGHLDTVEPAYGRHAVLHEDGTITSAGNTVLGADDQSGLAEIVEAIRCIQESHTAHRTIEFLITFGEEAFDKGSRKFDFSLLKARQAYTLDLEAPVGTASLWEPTLISFTVDIRGRSAHAGFNPEKGINALTVSAELIHSLPIGRVDPVTVLNIGMISGGTAVNAVPDHVVMKGELRSRNHEKALSLLKKIQDNAAESAEKIGAKASVDYEIALHEYCIDEKEPVVKRYEAACEKAGIKPVLSGSFGGSDNNQFAQHGGRGIVIASAMYNCHTVHEYTRISDMVQVARIVMNLMTMEEDEKDEAAVTVSDQ